VGYTASFEASFYICSGYTALPIGRLHPSAYNHSWREPQRTTRSPHYSKSIPSGMFNTLPCFVPRVLLTRPSLQDALRTFFQPIKTDDPRLDFYTMYKREATEYDTDYVKKYDEDLNTTLIFVRCVSSASAIYLTCFHRRVCSLPSARLSSSMSTRTSDLIRTSNPLPSSVPSSSPSISPPSPVRPPPSHLFSNPRRARSSPSPLSCTRV